MPIASCQKIIMNYMNTLETSHFIPMHKVEGCVACGSMHAGIMCKASQLDMPIHVEVTPIQRCS